MFTWRNMANYPKIMAVTLLTWSTVKGRICFSKSKTLPVKSRLHLERVSLPLEAKDKLWKLFPFVKMAEKYGVMPIHINVKYYQEMEYYRIYTADDVCAEIVSEMIYLPNCFLCSVCHCMSLLFIKS